MAQAEAHRGVLHAGDISFITADMPSADERDHNTVTRSSLFVRWTEPNQWRAKPISLDSANKIKFNIPWAVQTFRYNNAVLDVAKVPAVMEKARDMRVP